MSSFDDDLCAIGDVLQELEKIENKLFDLQRQVDGSVRMNVANKFASNIKDTNDKLFNCKETLKREEKRLCEQKLSYQQQRRSA